MAKIDKDNPCYMCEMRRVADGYNCHSDCTDYKAYKQKREDKAKALRKSRADEAMFTEVRIRSIKRTTKDKSKQIAWKG